MNLLWQRLDRTEMSICTEAERGTPEPRRTHLRSFAEDTSEAI